MIVKKIVVLFIFFLCSQDIYAKKLEIKADQLTYISKEKKSYATGRAQAILTDDIDKKVLHANSLTIFHSNQEQKNEDDNIERIEAFDNVIFEHPHFTLKAHQCIYEKQSQTVLCDECVHIYDKRKNHQIIGDHGKIDLRTDIYSVYKKSKPNQKEQAEAVFFLD